VEAYPVSFSETLHISIYPNAQNPKHFRVDKQTEQPTTLPRHLSLSIVFI